MTIDEIVTLIENMNGTLILRPGRGDGSPELAWGDVFFYYSPDGTVPTRTQPFATIVTKNYPDDTVSRLDRPGAFRVNIAAKMSESLTRTDTSTDDTLAVHPTYGSAGWVCVVNPGPATEDAVTELLSAAHARARARHER